MKNFFSMVPLAVILAACTTTQTVILERSDEVVPQSSSEFTLTSLAGGGSPWIAERTHRICALRFDVTVTEVYPSESGSAFVEIDFEDRQTGESFALMIYWDPDSGRVWPLLELDDSHQGEYLDIEFGLGETYSVSVAAETGEYMLIAEPKEKWDAVTNLKDGETLEITIGVLPVGVSFLADRVAFRAFDIDAEFRHVRVEECSDGLSEALAPETVSKLR